MNFYSSWISNTWCIHPPALLPILHVNFPNNWILAGEFDGIISISRPMCLRFSRIPIKLECFLCTYLKHTQSETLPPQNVINRCLRNTRFRQTLEIDFDKGRSPVRNILLLNTIICRYNIVQTASNSVILYWKLMTFVDGLYRKYLESGYICCRSHQTI